MLTLSLLLNQCHMMKRIQCQFLLDLTLLKVTLSPPA